MYPTSVALKCDAECASISDHTAAFTAGVMPYAFTEELDTMRKYIRHPSDIPIAYAIDDKDEKPQRLKDVSEGGLCFIADTPVTKGTPIVIDIILGPKSFHAQGLVAWCRHDGDQFSVGVAFDDSDTQYHMRMVEQVCYIEHYRHEVESEEGRMLSSEQAAGEWISKYAEHFPR